MGRALAAFDKTNFFYVYVFKGVDIHPSERKDIYSLKA